MYLGMLRWFTHFCTGKCIRMSGLHGCGTELILYCSVSLSGIAIYIGTDMCVIHLLGVRICIVNVMYNTNIHVRLYS